MRKSLAALMLASVTVTPTLVSPALAQPYLQAGPRVDQLRAGPHVLTVIEGSSPDAYNARNSLSRGIRIYERPHSSTFAAVAAQELFENEYKRSGGFDKRRMELISHQIEALVAARYGGHNLAQFEQKEAYTLTFYRQFRGMAQGQLLAAMRAQRPIAERWLADNRRLIDTLVAYRFPR